MIVEIAQWYGDNGHIEIAECLDLCAEQLGEGFRDQTVRIRMLQDEHFRVKLEQIQDKLDEMLLPETEFDNRCDQTLIRCGISRLSRNEGSVDKKGSATVLKQANDRFEKKFSKSIFCDFVFVYFDRGVGFFEARVSVFDGVEQALSIVAQGG